jgi:hypothetical protein
MSVPIPLRVDFDAVQLRGLARKTKDGPQARRSANAPGKRKLKSAFFRHPCGRRGLLARFLGGQRFLSDLNM